MLDDDSKAEICRLWGKGRTSSGIALLLGVSRSTVMGVVSRAFLQRRDKEPETLFDRMDRLARMMDDVLAQYPPGTGAFPLKPKRREPGQPQKPAWFLGAKKLNAGRRRTG